MLLQMKLNRCNVLIPYKIASRINYNKLMAHNLECMMARVVRSRLRFRYYNMHFPYLVLSDCFFSKANLPFCFLSVAYFSPRNEMGCIIALTTYYV